jgi:hypothetical protein
MTKDSLEDLPSILTIVLNVSIHPFITPKYITGMASIKTDILDREASIVSKM